MAKKLWLKILHKIVYWLFWLTNSDYFFDLLADIEYELMLMGG